MQIRKSIIAVLSLFLLTVNDGCAREKVVQRPPRIFSKRQVIYDDAIYKQLDSLWCAYYKAYPSEDAYGYWMYAARYAGNPDFRKKLQKGLKKYPGNPILLYLEGVTRSTYQEEGAGITELEKAAALDPECIDPWFALAISYLCTGEIEKADTALKRLLERGANSETVMDYSYNMISMLDKNAILITNGDNDTYPGWILNRIVGYRSDVNIVNRSLLESPWYPEILPKLGVPKFLEDGELSRIREAKFAEIAATKPTGPIFGVVSDTLIARIIEAADKAERPVYLAATCSETPLITKLRAEGVGLGFVTQVSGIKEDSSKLAKRAMRRWLSEFRTGGLDSWQVKYAQPADAGVMVAKNYAHGIVWLLHLIPDWRTEFGNQPVEWYDKHAVNVLNPDEAAYMRQYIEQLP